MSENPKSEPKDSLKAIRENWLQRLHEQAEKDQALINQLTGERTSCCD
jgi:hypothetical protein